MSLHPLQEALRQGPTALGWHKSLSSSLASPLLRGPFFYYHISSLILNTSGFQAYHTCLCPHLVYQASSSVLTRQTPGHTLRPRVTAISEAPFPAHTTQHARCPRMASIPSVMILKTFT